MLRDASQETRRAAGSTLLENKIQSLISYKESQCDSLFRSLLAQTGVNATNESTGRLALRVVNELVKKDEKKYAKEDKVLQCLQNVPIARKVVQDLVFKYGALNEHDKNNKEESYKQTQIDNIGRAVKSVSNVCVGQIPMPFDHDDRLAQSLRGINLEHSLDAVQNVEDLLKHELTDKLENQLPSAVHAEKAETCKVAVLHHLNEIKKAECRIRLVDKVGVVNDDASLVRRATQILRGQGVTQDTDMACFNFLDPAGQARRLTMSAGIMPNDSFTCKTGSSAVSTFCSKMAQIICQFCM